MATQMANDIAPAVTSILAADFGSVHTRAVLIDVVDGQYRLVSRASTFTTAAPPLGDVGFGLRRAMEQMSTLTGRLLLNGEDIVLGDQTDGTGVNLFLATASGGKPMKTVLIGLTPGISLSSGKRALASTYIELVDTITLADGRPIDDQVNAILNHQPDLIFIVGGTDGGAIEPIANLLQTVRLAMILARGKKPVVLFAGNESLKPLVKEIIGEEISLSMANNVRPALNDVAENLAAAQLELALVYGNYKSVNSGGYEEVQKTSALGVLPTAQSYANVMRYLGALPGTGVGVILVDVGSSTVTVCANVRKHPYTSIRSDLGLGHSAVNGLKTIGVPNVLRWLTFDAKVSDVMDYAWNKSLRPHTIPQTSQELEIEYALAREMARHAVADARQAWVGVPYRETLPAMRPIIGAGSILAQAVNPGVGALLMLDALQPVGISELRLDPYGVIAALGAIAYVEPLAVVQVLEAGGLLNLGTAISPSGRPPGGTAMEVTVKRRDGQTTKHTVSGGTLSLIELPTGQKAQVTIKLSRGLSLDGRSRVTLTLEGGAAGLILDARGRPLSVPKALEKRAELLPMWYNAVRGA